MSLKRVIFLAINQYFRSNHAKEKFA